MANVVFLWHMHQPYYVNPLTRVAMMPWVRLHCVKGYMDMISLVEDYPAVHMNFNLTPVLLLQIEEITAGRVTDLWLEWARKPAADLNSNERAALLENFFKANWDNLIKPHPRYWELLQKRGLRVTPGELRRLAPFFSTQELLDLQVWFNLAWCGYTAFRLYPELDALRQKDRGFTEAEKARLLDIHLEIMSLIPSKYRAAEERGQVELTTTPYYHPILPLVYDSAFAERSLPGRSFPKRFHWPEDATAQLTLAVEQHERLFSRKPRGLWPSEGSIAPELIPLMQTAGIQYFCSDEENLFESIRHDRALDAAKIDHLELFQGWQVEFDGATVNGVFREKPLSDFIGFMAAKNSPERGARHLLDHLKKIADLVPSDQGIIPLILDGENAWESFRDGGEAFLRELYSGLASDPARLHSCTIETYLAHHPPVRKLGALHTGSWIGANFDIWIGEDEENRAWDLLNTTRLFLQQKADAGTLTSQQHAEALREIYAAEGSDWFWWYGPDFFTDNDALFDELFRLHLKNVYTLCGVESPPELDFRITRPAAPVFIAPRRQITPVIDGRQTSFFEWLGAGTYLPGSEQSAMYHSERLFKKLWFGCDQTRLYLRLDFENQAGQMPSALVLTVATANLEKPIIARTEVIHAPGKHPFAIVQRGGKRLRRSTLVMGEIVEWALHLADLEIAAGTSFGFQLQVQAGGIELERYPDQSSITMEAPTAESALAEWIV
jgi:alpha-amylase/alpha-mannosidase (GH57 family)